MKNNLFKIYAAYRSGCLGNNILDTYFPFFANIIYEEHWDEIDADKVGNAFEQKYGIKLPLTFIRQVLGVGVQNNAIVDNRGQYVAQRDILKHYRFSQDDFEKRWNKMRSEFGFFCKKENIDLGGIDIDNRIMESLDTIDEIARDDYEAEHSDIFDYAWRKFVVSAAKSQSQTYEFISCLNACDIMTQAILYADSCEQTFAGLNIYLDSPMVFALLGMDVRERTESCGQLVQQAQAAGCSVFVFDHNFQEVEGIVRRAGSWARDPGYRIDKANNVARFFHDSEMSIQEIAEFCETLEDKLNALNISVKQTDYDVLSDRFQENEAKLKEMIEQRYRDNNQVISDEKRESIAVDVRSIIMVYRERKGQTAVRIQASKEIMLTLNGTIANVSKMYESNQSLNAGHIPACVSADLFGAVLWLFSPVEFVKYQKKQFLADCYIAMRPNRKMLASYVESLVFAKNAGEIDEKTFLFMRSSSMVTDALMNVTKGDYARFNERTHLEVYNEIVEKAEKKYLDEAASHKNDQKRWEERDSAKQRNIDRLTEENRLLNETVQREVERKAHQRGWVYTLTIAGLPYLLMIVIIEILKYVFVDVTFWGWIYAAGLTILTLFSGLLFQKVRTALFALARKHERQRKEDEENEMARAKEKANEKKEEGATLGK